MSESKVSEVSICNQALSWLGQSPIISLDDQNTTAELCRINYPQLRDALLELRPWTFAVARHKSETTELMQSNNCAEYTGWGEGYAHVVPNDWLLVYRVYRNITNAYGPSTYWDYGDDANWTREGDYVVASDAVVYMYGLRRITDPGKFSLLFVQALAARLAADLALPITQNAQLHQTMEVLYENKLTDAAARDGAQGRNEQIGNSRLIDSRWHLGA